MIDIAADIFRSKELTTPAAYRGVQLSFGCVISERFQSGRPGLAGEYRPQIREGAGDHVTIYIAASEPVLMTGKPRLNDAITVAEPLSEPVTYLVRAIRGSKGGVYELLSERQQSRLVRTVKELPQTGQLGRI